MFCQDKRHSLVWLSQTGWEQAAAALAPALRPLLQDWQQHDWPAVVRRRDADIALEQLSLGIALPPDGSGHKLRLPLRIARSQVRSMRAPLLIAEVLPQAPLPWRAALQKLQQQASDAGLELRVYGSLAWQTLTGQSYLRPDSDIDLWFSPGSQPQLMAGMQLLADYAACLPLDGEVQFPAGAVAWKEWQQMVTQSQARVLLKREHDVALLPVAEILATLPPCQTVQPGGNRQPEAEEYHA